MRCASCGLEVSEAAGGVCPTCGRVARGREVAPGAAAISSTSDAPVATASAAFAVPAESAESAESAPAVVAPEPVAMSPAAAGVPMEPAPVTPVGRFDGSGAWSAEPPESPIGAEADVIAPPLAGQFDASGAWQEQSPASATSAPEPMPEPAPVAPAPVVPAPAPMAEQGMPAFGQAAPPMATPMATPVAPPSAPPYGYAPYGQAMPPGTPYGYAPPPGQAGPPSMPMPPMAPMAPGQLYPGYVALPPQPARRSGMGGVAGKLIGALAAVVVIAACVGGLYLYGKNVPHTPGVPVGGDLTPAATLSPGTSVIYSDSLSGQATDWASDANCAVHSDGYHILDDYICYAPTDALNDTDVTVTATQVSGATNEAYGLVFRRASKGNYYSFEIDSNGKWIFLRCQSTQNDCTEVDPFTANAAIHSGLNVPNTLEVRAKGSHFDFFVNGTKVGQADDALFTTGRVGITGAGSGEVVYKNILITQPLGS